VGSDFTAPHLSMNHAPKTRHIMKKYVKSMLTPGIAPGAKYATAMAPANASERLRRINDLIEPWFPDLTVRKFGQNKMYFGCMRVVGWLRTASSCLKIGFWTLALHQLEIECQHQGQRATILTDLRK
jgi:hypothetical protein